jgi:hypothetical protein
MEPGHGGDVLIDVRSEVGVCEHLLGPRLPRDVDVENRSAQRAGVVFGDAVHVLRPGTGGGVNAGSLTLSYSTVVENSGGIVSNVGANSLASADSVVALPTGGRPNCGALSTTTTMSSGFNFSDDASCGFTGSGDTQNGGNPALGPLLNKGGPTLTRMPFFGSPLVDVIPPSFGWPLCGVATDQRGVSRPQTSFCDIGAVEAPPPA